MTDLPVASPWFRVTPIDGAITRIEEPYADPWVSANSWHVRGREFDVVFDTGLGVRSLRDELVSRFGREPVAILSHGHLDHMGSAHEFAECWAHEREPTEEADRGTLSGSRLLQILGTEAIGEDGPAEVMLTAVPHEGYDIGGYELRPVRPTRRLRDGDRIDLGERTLTVLHLPGHTPGSIGLHDEESRILFTGDVIYEPIEDLLDDLAGSDVEQYRASMRRLAGLDVDIVHPGHGESFSGERLRELVAEYLR